MKYSYLFFSVFTSLNAGGVQFSPPDCPDNLEVRTNSSLPAGYVALSAYKDHVEVVGDSIQCHYAMKLIGSAQKCSGSTTFNWINLPTGSVPSPSTQNAKAIDFRSLDDKRFNPPLKICRSSETEFISYKIPSNIVCAAFENKNSSIRDQVICREIAITNFCTPEELKKNATNCTKEIVSILSKSEIQDCDPAHLQIGTVTPLSDREKPFLSKLLQINEKTNNENKIYKIGANFLIDKGFVNEWQEFVAIGFNPTTSDLQYLCRLTTSKFTGCSVSIQKSNFVLSCSGGDADEAWEHKTILNTANRTLKNEY